MAAPTITLSDTKKSVRALLDGMAEMVRLEMQSMSEKYDELENAKSSCYSYNEYDGNIYVDNEKLQQIEQEQAELKEAYDGDTEIKNSLKNLDLSELKVEPVCELGIAYNNTFVTKMSDFIPCVMTSVSDLMQDLHCLIHRKESRLRLQVVPSRKNLIMIRLCTRFLACLVPVVVLW